MRLLQSPPSLVAVAALADAPPPRPRAQSVVSTPSAKTLYKTGPTGRYLMDGTWLFKLDNHQSGPAAASPAIAGWKQVTVPNAWNAGDDSAAVVRGRRRLVPQGLPAARATRQARVVGRALRVGQLPLEGLAQRQADRHEPRRLPAVRDPPARRPAQARRRQPPGHPRRQPPPADRLPALGPVDRGQADRRLVELRRPAARGLPAQDQRRRLQHGRRAARPAVRDLRGDGPLPRDAAQLRRRARGASRVTRALRQPQRSTLGTRRDRRQALRDVHASSITVDKPRLWSPASPYLYDASLAVRSGGDAAAALHAADRHPLDQGRRRPPVPQRRAAELPRRRRCTRTRTTKGFAIDNKTRDQQLAWVKELGATIIRSHYPLHPYTQERADELGIMQWSEIPVYSVKTQYLKQKLVRQLAARELESQHPDQRQPPVGDRLVDRQRAQRAARPGPGRLHRARREARARRWTRRGPSASPSPATRRPAASPSTGRSTSSASTTTSAGTPAPTARSPTARCSPTTSTRSAPCYPNKAIVVTEFGAEANRDGPVEEKGTYAFQQDFVNYHLGVYATKPWLSGAIYFALQEFRVRPNWDGGNPRPQPPIHQKGAGLLRRRAQAGVLRRPAHLPRHQAVPGRATIRAMTIATVGLLHPGAMGAAVGRVLTRAGRTRPVGVGGPQRRDGCARAAGGPAGRRHSGRAGGPQRPRPGRSARRTARSTPPARSGPSPASTSTPTRSRRPRPTEIRAVVEAAGARYVDGGIIGPPPDGTEHARGCTSPGADAPAVAERVRRQRARRRRSSTASRRPPRR